ncbi:ABC transporter substrate-binding protein [Castellaniella sp. FW104-16D08]|uniref:ABC transporter substrate-binding protein n=1 Tax=unclassified Castellaniella TaxID=2617606 RepID=UPI0033160EF7
MRMWISLLVLCLGLLPALAATQQTSPDTPAIITLDWTLAETLTAIGHPPAGVAQIADYHSWVGKPILPAETIDLGLRSQPSMELMAAMNPDLLLITPMFANMANQLKAIAPVVTVPLYDPQADTWQTLVDMTRTLGHMTHREAAAQALIRDTTTMLDAGRARLRGCGPLLVIQFADDRHLRVYGGNSLYQHVLDRLGIRNAWTGAVNRWGYRLLALHELAKLDGRVVIIEPVPLGTLARLQNNALWRGLPVVKQQPLRVLPPVWSVGGLPSAQRFAQLLEQTVCKP